MELIQGQIPGLEQNRKWLNKAELQVIVKMFFGNIDNNIKIRRFLFLLKKTGFYKKRHFKSLASDERVLILQNIF
jgi:hypothetical protein